MAAPSPRVNVVLGNLLHKWFGAESRARRLRAEGDALRERQELPGALEKYNQALEMGEWRRRGGEGGGGGAAGAALPASTGLAPAAGRGGGLR